MEYKKLKAYVVKSKNGIVLFLTCLIIAIISVSAYFWLDRDWQVLAKVNGEPVTVKEFNMMMLKNRAISVYVDNRGAYPQMFSQTLPCHLDYSHKKSSTIRPPVLKYLNKH